MSQNDRDAIEAAFVLLGWQVSWKKSGDCIASLDDRKLVLENGTVIDGLERELLDKMPAQELALILADALAVSVPKQLTESIDVCRALLRPRLITSEDLDGPSRALCRRPAWDRLAWGVSIGLRSRRTFVTTWHLDEWGLEFEDVFLIATENLRASFGPDLVCEVSGVDGLLAVMHDREPASSAVLFLDELIPTQRHELGHVFSIPNEATLLAMSVVANAGADALANLVQGTYAVAAEQSHLLSDRIYWRRGEKTTVLPMTWVEEGGVRRVHLDAEGEVGKLLQILGEID